MKSVRRLVRRLISAYRFRVLYMILISLIVSATPFGFSLFGRWLVDEALQVTPPTVVENSESAEGGTATVEWQPRTTEERIRLLMIFLIGSVGAHVIATLLSGSSELINAKVVHDLTFRLRADVHSKIEAADLGSFHTEQSGQHMTRILDDTGGIPGNLTNLVVNTVANVGMLILGIVLLLRLNPRMGLVAALSLPFFAVASIVFLPKLRTNTQEIRSRWSQLMGYTIERVSAFLTIKNYAQEQREVEDFGSRVDLSLSLNRRQNRLSLLFGASAALITAFGSLAVLYLGFVEIRNGAESLGTVLAMYQVTAQLFVPIGALVGMGVVVQTLTVHGDRVYTVLDATSALPEPEAPHNPSEIRGKIRFDHVTLRHDPTGPFAVRDLNFEIPAGSFTALVGTTGCGKSTVLSLITRLYDPSKGSVTLDGVDVRHYRVHRIRRAVGNVPFESTIFTGSVAENVRLGDSSIDDQRIIATLRFCGLEELAGELSREIRQEDIPEPHRPRLSLARALATNPAILAMDDPFSALDEGDEHEVIARLRREYPNVTLVYSVSRMSTAERADRIIVLQDGSLVETGTHPHLMSRPGLYRRMHIRQMGLTDDLPATS